MTKMTTTPENYNDIRAGIVELLKAALGRRFSRDGAFRRFALCYWRT